MKQVFKFDADGYYLEPVILDDNEAIPADCTDVQPQDGLYKGQFVNNAWVEASLQADILKALKATKMASLTQLCNEAIVSGFTSSALGTAHTYPSHSQAQTNFNTQMHRFLSDPTYTSCKFFTEDAGWLVHTKDQFFQAFKDGHDYGNSQWDKLFGLLGDVATATDKPSVDAITW